MAVLAIAVPGVALAFSVLPSQAAALPVAGGTYQLAVTTSGKCIDVPGWSNSSGVQLQQYTCVSSQANQLWRLVASGTNTFQIVSVDSGLCISDKDASTASGAPIIQETCTANSNKQWAFNAVGAGGRAWSDQADGFASTGGGTTGGAAGPTVTVSTMADLQKYVTATTPYVIKVNGAITISPKGTELKVYDYEAIQMDTADHIWIDHNTLTRMNDGLIDSRKDTSYLTVSWNVLSSNNKAFGIGWTENVTARMTIHHNWIRDTNQRNPSTDNVAYAHLYNNYPQNVASYGNYARGATKMVLENSYFQNVKDPYYPDSTAQLKQSGSVVVSSSGKQQTLGSAFTPSSFYAYTLDPAADVPALLQQYAGPQPNIGL